MRYIFSIYILIVSYYSVFQFEKIHPSIVDSFAIIFFLLPIIMVIISNTYWQTAEQQKLSNEQLAIEKEKTEVLKKKIDIEVAEAVNNGKLKFIIPMNVLKQITNGLTESQVYLTVKYPDIVFSDRLKQYTYKTNSSDKKLQPTMRQTLYSNPDFSMRINRKELLSTLRAFSDNYIEMSFDMNNKQLFTFTDRHTTVVTKIGV